MEEIVRDIKNILQNDPFLDLNKSKVRLIKKSLNIQFDGEDLLFLVPEYLYEKIYSLIGDVVMVHISSHTNGNIIVMHNYKKLFEGRSFPSLNIDGELFPPENVEDTIIRAFENLL